MIANERDRQISDEGYTAEHDAAHNRDSNYALLAAADSYIVAVDSETKLMPSIWPWDTAFWKPTSPVRMLVKAGALIAAEIDRRLAAGEEA